MSRFIICTAEQRSPEWFAARLGRATGSIAAAIKAKAKSGNGEAVTRRNERVRLAVERLTGVTQDDEGFFSRDMQRGVKDEPKAIVAWEARTGEIAHRTGFVSMTEHFAGCSLDFYIPGSAPNLIEVFGEAKCPKGANHVEAIESGTVPSEHLPQITHNFWVSGAKRCEFVSYCDAMPEHLQLFVVSIERREMEAEIKAYETEVLRFLAEVSITVKKYRGMKVAA